MRGEDRDGPENLVLLCPEHHILVDQQRKSHPVDWLYGMKEQHERWVTERLSPQERFLHAHPSTGYVTDTLHSTLLPVTHMPPPYFRPSVRCAQLAVKTLSRLRRQNPGEYIAAERADLVLRTGGGERSDWVEGDGSTRA